MATYGRKEDKRYTYPLLPKTKKKLKIKDTEADAYRSCGLKLLRNRHTGQTNRKCFVDPEHICQLYETRLPLLK